MNMKHAWMILLVILLVPFVSAEIIVNTYSTSNDFTVLSNDVRVCACSQVNDHFTITNTGTYTSTFYVGSDDSKTSFSESSFELDPGESRNIYTNIQTTCAPMKKDLTITVRNNLGMEKTFVKKINLERCQNLEMWLSNAEQNISTCGTATFTIYVKNIGTFDEDYKLWSNWDSTTTYSSNSFTLQPEQTAQITARTTFDCGISGQKDMTFTTEALKNSLKAEINAKVNIASDYAYSIEVDDKEDLETYVSVCNRLWSTQIPITVRNDGIDNEFGIKYDGLPGFVKPESELVALSQGESKTFYLNVDTYDFRDKDKQYNVEMIITPKYGESTIKKIRLALEDCYEHRIIIADDTKRSKPLEVCAGQPYNVDFEVYNNGKFDDTVRFRIEGAPNTVVLSASEMSIAPGTTNKGVLTIIGPETNEIYNIRIAALLQNGLEEKDDLWVKSYDSKACHAIEIKKDYRINYDDEELFLKVAQKGMIAGEYKIGIGDNDIATLEEKSLELSNIASIKLEINSENKDAGTYIIPLTLTHKDSDTVYEENINIILKDKSIFVKAYEYFTSDTCKQVTVYQAIVILLLIVLIFYFTFKGPHYPYKFWNRVSMKIPILIVLFIIFLVATTLVVMLAGVPKTNIDIYNLQSSHKNLHYEWVANDKYVLDATKFFIDPDKDSLNYEVSEIRNVKTKVNGGNILFYPERGWSGERTFTITAIDSQGGMMESPLMSLKVVPRIDRSFPEWYSIYCWYANLIIFLLILMLIFLIVIVKQKKRGKK